MKKTFSLKLMLLGLLASVSTGAMAQFTAVDGVVYGYSADNKNAVVVGVLKNLPAGELGGEKSIQIANEVTIQGKSLKVNDFAANWMHKGKFKCVPISGGAGTTPAVNPGLNDGSDWESVSSGGASAPQSQVVYNTVEANDIDGDGKQNTLDLIINASELKEITKSDIAIDETGNILPIAAFVIDENSGITVIPELMFAVCNKATTTSTSTWYGEPTKEAGEAKLDGEIAAKEKELYGKAHPAYKPETWTEEQKPEKSTATSLWGQLVAAQAAEAEAQEKADAAESALIIAKAKEIDPNYGTDDVKKKQAAERLKAAIAAFENNEEHPSYWPAIQQKVSQQTGTPVENVTAWYVFYALATGQAEPTSWTYWRPLVNEGIAAYKEFYGKDIQTVGIPVKADAYAFTSYGVAGDIFHAGDATVPAGTTFTTYTTGLVQDVTADPANPEGYTKVKVLENGIKGWVDREFYVQATATSFNPNTYYVLYEMKEEGLVPVGTLATPVVYTGDVTGDSNETPYVFTVKNGEEVVFSENLGYEEGESSYLVTNLGNHSITLAGEVIDVTGGKRVRVKEGTNQGSYIVASDGKVYKMLGMSDTFTQNEITGAYYYAGDVALLQSDAEGYSDVVVVKIGDKTEVTIETTTPDATEISAADPENDIEAAIENYFTVEEAQAAKDAADAELAEAQAATEAAQTAVDTAEGELADLRATTVTENKVTKTTYGLDESAKNETLVLAAFKNEKLETVGKQAFYNCVKAEFEGTFPATIDQIEEKAFANTQFKNLNLNNTNTIDRNKDEKINDADRLGDSNIANDAFLNTPLETMLLANTNLSSNWIQTVATNIKFEEKEYTDECGDEYTRMVNETLTTVELPEATAELDGIETLACDKVLKGTFENCIALTAIAFPAQINAIEDNAFCGDDALATITFAPENSELVWIGEGAFYHAAATTIDLSAQTKLGSAYSWGEYGGAFAFADMKNLESVNFTNTKIKSLPATIFNGDAKLATVTFYDAANPKSGSFIETLPEGLFKDNAIAVLDIAKTKITVLKNLFQAGNGSQKAKDCNGNQIILDPFNETLTAVKLPAWLKEIKTNALAHMHNKDFKTVEIPGSVEELGEGVFGDDKYLETVSFFNYENDPAKKDFLDGSMMTQLPAKTFAQCPNLKNVYFVTYETLDNDVFGDNCFFSAGTNNPGEDARTKVYVNHDSFDALKSTVVYSSTYSKLMAFETSLKGKEINGLYYKPWTSNYGTWIEAVDEGENAVGVYTAYQDGHKIILYPAKKSTFEGKQYYKIAAYNDDQAKAALGFPAFQPTSPIENEPILPSYNGFYYVNEDGLEVFVPFPAIGETFSTTGAAAATIPAEIAKLLEARVSFGSMGVWGGGFKPSTDVLAKTWMAFGTAIIISSKQEVPYIQKTNPDQKYQSTLDLANQLSVTSTDIPRDDDNNWYYLAKTDGKAKFIHQDTDSKIKFIPKGSVAFLQTSKQGQGAREFDIDIVSENEATAIGGVMEYISAKNSDAIYNLQGVRVSATQKGQMYIQGGKKFIQK